MISISSVQDAHIRIRDHVIHTPLISSDTLSTLFEAEVFLKLETLQRGGSFKVRGAMNKILSHTEDIRDAGVVAASAGNHAQGVAIAAKRAGIPAVIVMPAWSSLSKQEATRGYGAEVILCGQTIEESVQRAEDLSHDGRLFIHPFDDPDVIAGQGTIGLEIFADLAAPDLIIVPVGGGGLIAGIAIAVKAFHPSCRIIGVQAGGCPSAGRALDQGEPVCVSAGWTLADGIRVTRTGSVTFPVIRDLVDGIVNVTDDQIAAAILWLMERKKVVSEGAGAAPLAALISGLCPVTPGSRVVLIISGGNVDSHQVSRILGRALSIQGRTLTFSVIVDDQPGALARLLTLIGSEGGNILQIHHTPGDPNTPIQEIRVAIELETRGPDHVRSIRNRVESNGYRIV